VPFTYATDNATLTTGGVRINGTGGVGAVLLSAHLTAYDVSKVGAIQGTMQLSNLTDASNIQVTAESLSTDGTRHIPVNSAPVKSDGTFTLYPLSSTSSSPTSYDLVIHGPNIASVIVKGVTVNVGDPSTTTPVSIGSVALRDAIASPFTLTLDTTTPLPAGAVVGFYQTLPGVNEVPYLIEQKTIDPFTRVFPTDQGGSVPPSTVSASTNLDFGTFSSSGATISLSTTNPQEGAGAYRLAASAPLFADGPLTDSTGSTTITGAITGAVTVPIVTAASTGTVVVPTLVSASGFAATGTTVNVSHTTSSFDRGDLIISHDGAIVATAVLDTALSRSGASLFAFPTLPAGGATTTTPSSALYYVSVRVWSSSDPANTLKREIYPAALDLRNTVNVTYSLNID
jgi:hypothetical protein